MAESEFKYIQEDKIKSVDIPYKELMELEIAHQLKRSADSSEIIVNILTHLARAMIRIEKSRIGKQEEIEQEGGK